MINNTHESDGMGKVNIRLALTDLSCQSIDEPVDDIIKYITFLLVHEFSIVLMIDF